ncbi:MAG TPA: dipeptide epimerase [Saprospiraceae bacterium]|nr:dipeptide epimerase [Saprospiraceae bacterium]HNT20092.1 dipeptide epimerase [Saprospiraceae bacterium]
MKIRSIRFRLENLQLSKPYTIAWKTVDQVENLFCFLETDQGITGYGSCNPENEVVHVSTKDTLEAMDLFDRDLLLNKSLDRPADLIESLLPSLHGVPTLLAALDIAVWDAWSKGLGKPLVEALGKKIGSLPTSVTIGIMEDDQTVKEAKEFLDRGFTHLKIKIGLDPERDAARLVRLRKELGPGPFIRVDVNQGYRLEDFKKLYTACAELNIELFEQPLRTDWFDQIDALPREVKSSIAADESLHGESDARQIASAGRCGIYNIKLMKCGGLHQAGKLARIAETHDINLMWGCNDESRLSITAALHLAYACGRTRFLDLDGSFDLARDPASGGFDLIDGKLIPLERPGLGIFMDND